MIGSAVDVEAIVQEALAKVYAAIPATSVANLRVWLFRIAQNKAIDFLRRANNQPMGYLDEHLHVAALEQPLEEPELVAVALSVFLKLVPRQRSCVILKDVLGRSLAEISELLDEQAVDGHLQSRTCPRHARSRKPTSRAPRQQA